ncbi:hypothetical protein VTN00DRAFT_9228 [Thermoascus crustaceus]|uniref:uncharacterized protein n=1 Tax=Thermoascus crustaceus TaxID=5088 RepID=UPI0037444CC6
MSSLRNAVYRRQHRERGQLEGREKWGILEKHKDYSLRAKDYNIKKAKLQRLREKARDRNPDEFAFGMLSQTSGKQGRHGAREGQSLSLEAVKLFKTQDAGYLRVVGERVRREMEKLEKDVQLQEGMKEVLDGNRKDDDYSDEEDEGKPKKVVFADSREEQKEIRRRLDNDDEDEDEEMDEEEDEDGEESFGQQQKRREQEAQQQQNKKKSKKELEAERQAFVEMRAARKMKKRAAEARRNKLEALRRQHEEITAAEQELDWQRARMENSVGGTNKHGIKWKIRERKR